MEIQNISVPPAEFRIRKISQLEYSIKSKPNNYNIAPENCDVVIDSELKFDPTVNEAKIVHYVSYIDKTDRDNLMHFNVEFNFEVVNFKDAFQLKENKSMLIPDAFLFAIISVSIGTTRGMLLIRNSGTFLSEIYLPILDTVQMLDKLKTAMIEAFNKQLPIS